jgi:Uncharacterised protein family (UPF0183)
MDSTLWPITPILDYCKTVSFKFRLGQRIYMNAALKIQISPGIGIGKFILGSSMGLVLDSLTVEFEVDISKTPTVKIPSIGIELKFDEHSQKLLTIELQDLSLVEVLYDHSLISSSSTVPTFPLVYKLFGPIYPGVLDESNRIYSLNYPGVSFCFPLDKSFPFKASELPFASSDGTTPVLKKIQIFNGPSFEAAIPRKIEDCDYFEQVLVFLGKGIVFEKRHLAVNFGDTLQDVLCAIGPPEEVFVKEKDQMGIHTAEEGSKFAQDYFWNYFSLGFDILFDGPTHAVKKLVLHTNLLNHYLSMKYSRCNFKFEDLEGEITHSCTWSSIKKVLGEPIGPPVIFEREDNPFGFTSFYAYTNCLFEVSKGEKIASVTLI